MIPVIVALAAPVVLAAEMISGRKDAKAMLEFRQAEHDADRARQKAERDERNAAAARYQARIAAEEAARELP